ncbi:MAG TPA: threonine synthase [Candidatus Aquilonibacter sp.]|nr:threonine synthase [Candidatus Aquilonibacter sp.]
MSSASLESACTTVYELRCNECGKSFGNRPQSACDDCLAPLEVKYDLESVRGRFTRESIAAGPANIWRYKELLPIPAGYQPDLPVGFTPLVRAKRLGKRIGSNNLYVKNDAVCFPTLSFKDRVVSIALANAQAFGFDVVGCSSTGNLANSVAAQASRLGLKACILVPADLEAAKILNTQVYGARLVRIDGNYDHVNRLCTLIADEYNWGFVNVNLRPYYAEGSKTVGYEIAEQLGWRLPDNVVCPMAGGSLIRKIKKAFDELVALGLVEPKHVKFFGAQATGCSPISTAVKNGRQEIDPQRPLTIARSLAIGNPADGPAAAKMIRATGGFAEDVSDVEVVAGIQELAETEGIFTETAGGVTTAVTAKLIAQGRIGKDETTVVCITGNGLKTTDALAGCFHQERAVKPKLAEFDAYLRETDASLVNVSSSASAAAKEEALVLAGGAR